MQLHRPEVLRELEASNARILVVSFASVERMKQWIPFFEREYVAKLYAREGKRPGDDLFARTTFTVDPTLEAYHAFGLGRHSAFEAYGPRIVWQYLRWIAAGKPLRMAFQDTLQRGGDFVIGRDGRLTLAQVGRDQAGRPTCQEILSALRN